MANLEPFVVVKSTQEVSLKKAVSKIKGFIDGNHSSSAQDGKQLIQIGKISDELLSKLQTVYSALSDNSGNDHEEKKSKKHKIDGEDETSKPKKKKSRKSTEQ